jgi:hypothetical protein
VQACLTGCSGVASHCSQEFAGKGMKVAAGVVHICECQVGFAPCDDCTYRCKFASQYLQGLVNASGGAPRPIARSLFHMRGGLSATSRGADLLWVRRLEGCFWFGEKLCLVGLLVLADLVIARSGVQISLTRTVRTFAL